MVRVTPVPSLTLRIQAPGGSRGILSLTLRAFMNAFMPPA